MRKVFDHKIFSIKFSLPHVVKSVAFQRMVGAKLGPMVFVDEACGSAFFQSNGKGHQPHQNFLIEIGVVVCYDQQRVSLLNSNLGFHSRKIVLWTHLSFQMVFHQ